MVGIRVRVTVGIMVGGRDDVGFFVLSWFRVMGGLWGGACEGGHWGRMGGTQRGPSEAHQGGTQEALMGPMSGT